MNERLRHPRWWRRGVGAVVILLTMTMVTAGLGCGSNGLRLPTDAAGTSLFEQGQAELENRKWKKAAEAFDTLLRNYPTSPHMPEARIGLGRAYYEQGRTDTLMMAVDAFENFLTYHPSHRLVDYSQLMIGMSYGRLLRAPDRDQSHTRLAVDAYRIFIEDYPDSGYRADAEALLTEAIDRLADHELRVARWQLSRDLYDASRGRCRFALDNYPETTLRCELTFVLGETYRRAGDAQSANEYYGQVVEDYPECLHAERAREFLEDVRGVAPALPNANP